MTRPSRVDFISVHDFYDYPRSGWIRVGWRRYWFEDPGDDEDYEVFDTEVSSRIAHLRKHRLFRHLVGWHWDYDSRRNRPIVGRFPRPSMDEFYAYHDQIPPLVKLGVLGTTDLRTVTWRDKPDVAP